MVSPFDVELCLVRSNSGRIHLPLPARIRWFRSLCPNWGIVTVLETVDRERGWAVIRTNITDETGHVHSSSTKADDSRNRTDWLESIENASIERALILAGFQHENEFTQVGNRFQREHDGGPDVPEASGVQRRDTIVPLPEHLASLKTGASLLGKPITMKEGTAPSLMRKATGGVVERYREPDRSYSDPGGDDEPTEDDVS